MTFNEWFEEYQPTKKNDGDSGLIIFVMIFRMRPRERLVLGVEQATGKY